MFFCDFSIMLLSKKLKKYVYNIKIVTKCHSLNSRLFNNIWHFVEKWITYFAYKFLKQKIVSNCLKISTIVSISKVKNSSSCKDLRPVNMLPVVF